MEESAGHKSLRGNTDGSHANTSTNQEECDEDFRET
jgi:hypothetical protein